MQADDISNLSSTTVKSIISVRDLDDIKKFINSDKPVCFAGTRHSMGGQTMIDNGYQLDFTCFDRILNYNETTKIVIVQPGARWYQVIKYLNQYGRSLEVMQSYSSFSVGGSISVNAHGITSDRTIAESVAELTILTANNRLAKASPKVNPKLFSHVIGGYGLFGVIVEVALKTVPNYSYKSQYCLKTADQFPNYFRQIRQNSHIDTKMCRINLFDPNQIQCYTYLKDGPANHVSNLPEHPNMMGTTTQLMYKWLMPHKTCQSIRYKIENSKGKPIDVNTTENSRNLLVYESAKPLADLYSPLIELDKTHILQEYFVPENQFKQWYSDLLPILAEIHQSHLDLLNITIRFVEQDTVSSLPYAKENSFCFVFYYRIDCDTDSDSILNIFHRKLVSITHKSGGTFYLPYRLNYNHVELLQSYPEISNFLAYKYFCDPMEQFNSKFYQYLKQITVNIDYEPEVQPDIEYLTENTTKIVKSGNHPDNFLLTVSKNENQLRSFLSNVFIVGDTEKIINVIKNHAPTTDLTKTYDILQQQCQVPQLSNINRYLAQLKLNNQLMSYQSKSITDKLGLTQKIRRICMIGDSGRYIKKFRKTYPLGKQNIYIVHDHNDPSDMIERKSITRDGNFVKIDYDNIEVLNIPDNSVDLVTIFIGLHHFNVESRNNLLSEIHRILRPNGLFILRDHDTTNDNRAMITSAHYIFNAVTGIKIHDELDEFRDFKSLNEWRQIVKTHDFRDTYVYEKQEGDPTDNLLMCFQSKKQPEIDQEIAIEQRDAKQSYQTPMEWFLVDAVQDYGQFMTHTPWYNYPYISVILNYWQLFFEQIMIVWERNGFFGAVFSSYNFMNLVIGLIMTGIFLILSLLAIIPRKIYNGTEAETIDMVLNIDDDNFDYGLISECQSAIKINQSKYLLKSYRYYKFTQLCKRLCKFNVAIEQIANQRIIVVKTTSPNFKHSKVINQYILPETTYYLHEVAVKNLLKMIRSNINSVVYIHDF